MPKKYYDPDTGERISRARYLEILREQEQGEEIGWDDLGEFESFEEWEFYAEE